jgi:hypothetical protein
LGTFCEVVDVLNKTYNIPYYNVHYNLVRLLHIIMIFKFNKKY